MNIVVPIAGRGSRFTDRGITMPKPLIPVAGRPMIARALESLRGMTFDRLIVVALKEHAAHHPLIAHIRQATRDDAHVILLDDVTDGQLRTVMAARDLIDGDDGVLIANCDTYIDSDLGACIADAAPDCHGIISTVSAPGDRWSFARTDESGRVVEVAEKVRISDHASTGYYYFSSGRELCAIADAMFAAGETTRGEYYVIPVYQKMIARGWRVEIAPARAMWDMGTPEALAAYQAYLHDHPA
jgi:dTDP-glucose pyrophosphorylase